MNPGNLLRLFTVVVALSQSILAGDGAPWPRFRGPDGNGIAADATPPIQFGPESNVLWKTPVPTGHSSPCVTADHLFLTAFDEGTLKALAYSRRDGQLLWQRDIPAKKIEEYHETVGSPASSTPCTDGERVFFYLASFGVICFDIQGNELWRHPLPLPYIECGFGTGSSPIVHDGTLVLQLDDDGDPHLLALDAKTGLVRWRKSRPGYWVSWSTPVVWKEGDVSQVIVMGRHALDAYRLADGRHLWKVPGLPTAICSSPVATDETVYVAAWTTTSSNGDVQFGNFREIRPMFDRNNDNRISYDEASSGRFRDFFNFFDVNRDKFISSAEWDAKIALLKSGTNVAMAVTPGTQENRYRPDIVWETDRSLPYVASPLIYENRFWMVRDGGILTVLDPDRGRPMFQKRLGAGGDYYASPLGADGRVYLCSVEGVVTVVASADTYQQLAQVDMGERIFASPAAIGKTLYLRTEHHLYAFGK